MPAVWPIDPSTVLFRNGIELRLAVPGDAGALFRALDHDECWTHVRGRPDGEGAVWRAIVEAVQQGRWMWVVRQEGEVVGTTSYLDVVPDDERIEIGYTVYRPDAWGTAVNPTCKYLLMDWAFEHGFGRVQLKTDVRNERSQAAIARLGAGREGVLRRYQRRADQSMRYTVMFSVLLHEWPEVRQGLLDRID